MLENFRLRRHHLRGLDGRVRGVPVRGAKGKDSHGTRKFKWKKSLKKSARVRLLCLADNFRERDRRGVHGLPAVRHHWRAGARLPRRVRERGRLPGETNLDTSFEFPSTNNLFLLYPGLFFRRLPGGGRGADHIRPRAVHRADIPSCKLIVHNHNEAFKF